MDEFYKEEESFLSIVLRDKKLAKDFVGNKSNLTFFSPNHKHIIAGVAYAAANDTILTDTNYRAYIKNYLKISPQEQAAEMAIWSNCFSKDAETDDFKILLETIKNGFIERQAASYLVEFQKDKKTKDTITAAKNLANNIANLESEVDDVPVTTIDVKEYSDIHLANLEAKKLNPVKKLLSGIPEIDQTMAVGFKPGHLTIFSAPSGTFKTTIMTNVATNMFVNSDYEARIAYFPLEMGGDEIFTKIISRQSKVPSYNQENPETLTDEQFEILREEGRKWKEYGNNFKIVEISERAKLSVIRRELEKLYNWFRPNVVFIDYADNIIPDERRSRSDLEMDDILEGLRKYGKNMGFSVVTAAQLSRDAIKRVRDQKDDAKQLDSTDIRGGQVMTANADNVYAQIRHPQEPNAKLMFFCLKARHGNPTFKDGKNKTILSVQPHIAYIESATQFSPWNDQSSIEKSTLDDIAIAPVSFDEDEDTPF